MIPQHEAHKVFQADAFDYLRDKPLNYDIVILDPPAFAKKRSDITNAARGYHEINCTAIKKMPPHSLLLTSSCSSYIDATLFQQIIFQAAAAAGLSASSVAISKPSTIPFQFFIPRATI